MLVMLHRVSSLLAWLLHLFNPPPRADMKLRQKIARVLWVTVSLMVTCVLGAMVGALGVYMFQKGYHMLADFQQFVRGLAIILIACSVNAVCVMILLEIRRADRKLMLPTDAPKE